MAKKMYHVADCVSGREWFVLAKGSDAALEMILHKVELGRNDYDIDNDFEITRAKNGVAEIVAENKIEMY